MRETTIAIDQLLFIAHTSHSVILRFDHCGSGHPDVRYGHLFQTSWHIHSSFFFFYFLSGIKLRQAPVIHYPASSEQLHLINARLILMGQH